MVKRTVRSSRERRNTVNSVDISGRMTRDPEVRYAADKPFAKFCLAVNRRFKQDGQANADFINCVAFGKTAEFIEKYGRKGVKFEIHGRWQTGSYKNKDGQTVYTNDCLVEQIEFSESKSSNSGGNDSPSTQENDGFMNIPDGIDEELPFN
jgi:single-strand DNA-binding protein